MAIEDHKHTQEPTEGSNASARRRWHGPLRLLAVTAFSAFVIEAVIMVFMPDDRLSFIEEAVIDASLLTVALVAVLHHYMLRPLNREIEQRDIAEEKLVRAHARLEREVSKRTAELTRTNEMLMDEVQRHASAEAAVVHANDDLTSKNAELESKNAQISLLSELSKQLQTCDNKEEAYRVVVRIMKRLFPTASGALYVIDSSRSLVDVAVDWGSLKVNEPGFASSACWALRSGSLNVIEDRADSELCSHVRSSDARPGICIPMMAQGEALGVLMLRCATLEKEEVPLPKPDSRQRIAESAAETIALSLANLNLRETARNESVRDPLTGLLNRRYMEEALERELSRASRNKSQLGVVMLDIDHFKEFNDVQGHEAADAVLRELGTYLQQQVRGGDVVCRYGGEEFVFILPETNASTVIDRMEQVRNGAKQLVTRHRDQLLGSITVSAGIAVYPFDGATRDDLFEAADKAMYHAKHEGRDAVRAFREISAA